MKLLIPAVAALFVLSLGAVQTQAEPARQTLGWGHMFSNDALGDQEDRWRTGSYTLSRLQGAAWQGKLPHGFGEILEFRLRTEMIAPSNLANGSPKDRRYAGVLTLGLHSHFEWAGFQTSLGADLAITGDQNGLARFHSNLHEAMNVGMPGEQVLANQIDNGFHPTAVIEIGKPWTIGDTASLRPFIETQAGLENFLRAGADLTIGGLYRNALMLRENGTGQLYRAIAGTPEAGASFTLGGDITRIFHSELLPQTQVEAEKIRKRLRAGMAWEYGGGASAFYGLTWLSEEFIGQPEGQLLGSVNINLLF